MVPLNNYSIYKSNIKDHWSQITITNIIIMMKKFEMFQGLPKGDTETWGEQMLLEKNTPIDRLYAGLPQAFNL